MCLNQERGTLEEAENDSRVLRNGGWDGHLWRRASCVTEGVDAAAFEFDDQERAPAGAAPSSARSFWVPVNPLAARALSVHHRTLETARHHDSK